MPRSQRARASQRGRISSEKLPTAQRPDDAQEPNGAWGPACAQGLNGARRHNGAQRSNGAQGLDGAQKLNQARGFAASATPQANGQRHGEPDDPSRAVGTGQLPPETRAFYRDSIMALQNEHVPFLVGGAYALAQYVGVTRHTRDFDVFVRREDLPAALDALRATGCDTEVTFPHWLGKAMRRGELVDVIFSSGNGVAEVDESWFCHAIGAEVFDLEVKLVPAEEMIWSKAFIMERERFDGADVAHLVRALTDRLDWKRLLERFGENWRILLSHLILVDFIYPGHGRRVPSWVMRALKHRLERALDESETHDDSVCRGTLLSRAQYLVDVEHWGYRDARLAPEGPMSSADVQHWTAAIRKRA